ncbi:hypothetical protein Psed_6947 (plasmid) [Pseudonocardia dioxanivorans CB1190]|uniref:Restriction endonuclease type IV Mrr domain-containing protein n=1 Tax=Pseudonocardia dioxanivorans (strain ATCC 55486 / DSM 44775 / JCM 13855 / CB1190) TaxID=675635 RepID=F2L738_PSEUX|nr:hypothetical protein Psed_6947 [Pseudonocardia dioxanivorans CB1190]
MPEGVRAAVIRVCRDAFYYRDDVRAIFLDAGCPAAMYDRYDVLDNSKAKIARFVLNDLRSLGGQGQAIQRKLVQELCQMDRPRPEADPVGGREAIAELKREATKIRLLVDSEQAAAKQRRAKAEQQQRAQARRQEQLGEIRQRFYEHLKERPRSTAEIQQRGYALEGLIADLFELHDFQYRRAYRLAHEQIDGSFHFRGFTYLVEAKWEANPPTFSDIAKLKANLDGKAESTRGLFVAMAGYDDNVLEHMVEVFRRSPNNLVLVDGQDLIMIFEGRLALVDALIAKIDAAEQEGKVWYPLGR